MVLAKKPVQSLSVTDNRTGQSYELPISLNSVLATDIKKIKADPRGLPGRKEDETEQGLRVYDPAYMNTAVVQSSITYINGSEGVLRYRGYPIDQLVRRSNFLDSAYLLIYGKLPSPLQYDKWQHEVMLQTHVHSNVEVMFKAFRHDSHPMSMLIAGFAILGAFSPEASPSQAGQQLYTAAASGNLHALQAVDEQIVKIIAKAPTLAAAAYRVRQGLPSNRPAQGLSYTANFLYMLDHSSGDDYRPHPVLVKALDALFVIHADHEMNCSTATVLQAASSLVDPYSAVAAGCAALFGPSHGGAAEGAIRQLMEIGSPENVPAFLAKVERRERLLVGFGHRVYRTVDPRSTAIRALAEEVFQVTGRNQLLDTAMVLADAALKSDFMRRRNLYPNVDFYSGLIYQAMGFSLDFFPVLFAVCRCVGWLAHWRQMMLNPAGVKIWRPRQLYVGEAERQYVELADRSEDGSSGPADLVQTGDSKRQALATYKKARGKTGVKAKL